MAESIGYSTLDIIPTFKGLQQNLDKGVSGPMQQAATNSGRKFGDTAGREAGTRFSSKFRDLSKGAFAPVAGLVAGAAVVGFFKDAISGASDLAESANKVQQIFGDATGQVQTFAAQGAKALGQTKLEVLDAASSFGTFGKAAGLQGDELAGFATKLAGLSTDMASFFNTDPSVAVEAIGAALRGEAEPIRQFGVLLDDATLRNEALRQGLIKTTSQALTPQQKVLAAYQVILKQTKVAQGDFGRTSGGLANQQRILSAQWREMEAEVGSHLLPVMTSFVTTLNNGVIPSLEAAGGAAGATFKAFGGLPSEIKTVAAAFVALRIASATGFSDKLSSQVPKVTTLLKSAQSRAESFRGEFSKAREGILEFSGNTGRAVAPVGRFSASITGLKAATAGAGSSLGRGLRGVSNLLGGPWGIAFLGATALVGHFIQAHQQAKQRVEDFTATLDAETGAITENSRQWVAKRLLDAGVLNDAKNLGLNLSDVTDAALGQAGALDVLNRQLTDLQQSGGGDLPAGRAMGASAAEARNLQVALNDTNGTVKTSARNFEILGEAIGQDSSTTKAATTDLRTYASRIDKAKDKVLELWRAENKRRDSNLSNRRDQIGLRDALRSAREEADKGKKVLFDGSKAADANMSSLLDLADQWQNSSNKVRNAQGAYENIRKQFIKLATAMGGGTDSAAARAKNLADQLLDVPKSTKASVSTPGMDKALADLKRLRDLQRSANATTAFNIKHSGDSAFSITAHASGGLIGGIGTGRSDSNLIAASRGEFMQQKAAVDYYGVAFMQKINNRALPKFADGGLIGGHHSTSTTDNSLTLVIDKVVTPDAESFIASGRRRAIGGVPIPRPR